MSEAASVPWRAALLMLFCAACGHARDEPRAGAVGASSTFAREGFAPGPGDAGADPRTPGAPPVPASANPAALDEILAAVPRSGPGGTGSKELIGTDTGVPVDPGAGTQVGAGSGPDGVSKERPRRAQITIGKVTHEAGVASASIERAARAQLYWPLVQRCREDGGALLPPEVVRLSFQLDREGYVVPSSILAVPREPGLRRRRPLRGA